ncbi:MAG: GNAT family N-acetyltransferase [Desulfitobacteriia bacterium]|jgi:GNAT superfamily N-acetyltransferase
MEIKLYSSADEICLFNMLREEGPEWECYYNPTALEKYRAALTASLTYVAYNDNTLCGFVRCRDDNGFGLYIYDLLVRKSYRGHGIGRQLLEFVCAKHPQSTVYVMSDTDEYYQKLGCRREGSIFQVQ